MTRYLGSHLWYYLKITLDKRVDTRYGIHTCFPIPSCFSPYWLRRTLAVSSEVSPPLWTQSRISCGYRKVPLTFSPRSVPCRIRLRTSPFSDGMILSPVITINYNTLVFVTYNRIPPLNLLSHQFILFGLILPIPAYKFPENTERFFTPGVGHLFYSVVSKHSFNPKTRSIG